MDAFVGEIRPVGFNFAPRNWMLCQGQTLSIAQNTALFSILGTSYGGDGRTTFNLPNLCGQAVVGVGQGPGLSLYKPGQVAGTETVTLTMDQLPAHVHAFGGTFPVQDGPANSAEPAGGFPASTGENNQYSEGPGSGTMAANLVQGAAGVAGGSQPHSNMMPSLCINYIICVSGIFPPRS
ncbi:phage tail protein [Hymenobacter monticola]|uniref:Tail fiber protein n=1 Tax=Hymenobacter monticola TaxID=1705399 RepID=A0ABY4B014_9BACT|nr:tail fiber protein [Hymenobacter monticola]UOE32139.1 tail fiber protein [Hymenobacter monticola]